MKHYSEYLKAKKLSTQKEYKKALEIYNQLYEEDNKNDLVNLGIANCLINIYGYEIIYNKEAEIKIRDHIKKTQLLGIPYLGKLELRLGNIQAAKKYFIKALKFGELQNSYFELIGLELMLGNVEEAKKYYIEYKKNIKENYHNRSEILINFGIISEELGNIDLARESYNYLLEMTNYKEAATRGLMHVEVIDENYEQAYNRYLELQDFNSPNTGDIISIYVLYKVNKLTKDYPTRHTYYLRQLFKYDKNLAIKHISNHKGIDRLKFGIFHENIDINEMYNICSKKIEEMTPITSHDGSDTYLIDFDYLIGTNINKKTNRVRIKALPKTKNILTMYPSITEKIDIVDKSTKIETKKNSSQLIKRKSQIEKFNNRYKL